MRSWISIPRSPDRWGTPDFGDSLISWVLPRGILDKGNPGNSISGTHSTEVRPPQDSWFWRSPEPPDFGDPPDRGTPRQGSTPGNTWYPRDSQQMDTPGTSNMGVSPGGVGVSLGYPGNPDFDDPPGQWGPPPEIPTGGAPGTLNRGIHLPETQFQPPGREVRPLAPLPLWIPRTEMAPSWKPRFYDPTRYIEMSLKIWPYPQEKGRQKGAVQTPLVFWQKQERGAIERKRP